MGDFFSALLWGGLGRGLRRHGGVCGLDYHFAIFRYEKYKKNIVFVSAFIIFL